MVVIKVPKTPKRAFNKDRPASDLLRAQVTHLEAVAAGPSAVARGMEADRGRRKPMSEGQAAEYIATFTRQVQTPTRNQAAARATEPPPVPTPATPTPRKKKKSTRRAKRSTVARKQTARTRKAKRAKAR
jgi:hypothetical protein